MERGLRPLRQARVAAEVELVDEPRPGQERRVAAQLDAEGMPRLREMLAESERPEVAEVEPISSTAPEPQGALEPGDVAARSAEHVDPPGNQPPVPLQESVSGAGHDLHQPFIPECAPDQLVDDEVHPLAQPERREVFADELDAGGQAVAARGLAGLRKWIATTASRPRGSEPRQG
jgi:hypothetical protein